MNDLENRVLVLEGLISNLIKSDRYIFQKNIQLFDGRKIQLGKTTGTMIGTSATEKLGLFGVTPVVQQTFSGETSGMTTPGGATVQENSGFQGASGSRYTIHGIVDALKNIGILAQ